MNNSTPTSVRILRALRYDTAGQVVVQIAALGTGVVLARALGPTDFGRLALVMAVAASAALISNLGGTETATRFIAELKAKGRLSELVKVAWPLVALRLATSLLAGVAVVLLRGPLGELIGLEAAFSLSLACMAAIYAAVSGLQGPSQVLLVNTDRQRYINLVSGLTSLIGFGVLLALGTSGTLTLDLAVLVTLVALTVRVAFFVGVAIRVIRSQPAVVNGADGLEFAASSRRRIMRYSGVMFLIGVGGFLVQSRSDEYFVGAILGVQAVAFYHIAEGFSRTAFSLPVSRLSGYLMTGLLTEGYVQSGVESVRNRFRHIVRLRFALSVPIGFGGALLAPEIVAVVYGPEYSAAASLLALFILLQMPLQWTGAISGVLVAVEKPQWFLWTKAVSLLTVPLAIWWLKVWGVEGAVVATSLGMAGAAGIEFVAARRYTGISFPLADVSRYLLAGVLMAIPVAGIAEFMPGPAWVILTVGIPVGAITYVAATLLVRAHSAAEVTAIRESVMPRRVSGAETA